MENAGLRNCPCCFNYMLKGCGERSGEEAHVRKPSCPRFFFGGKSLDTNQKQ